MRYAWVRNRSALPTTEKELKLIASTAIIGDRRIPENGCEPFVRWRTESWNW